MVDVGFKGSNNDVIMGPFNKGSPFVEFLNVGVATNMKPGRLVQRELTGFDVKVGGIGPVNGWLGYVHAPGNAKPTDMITAYEVDKIAPVHKGKGFRARSSLAMPCILKKDEFVANWINGQVIGPVIPWMGGLALKIPFTKKTAEEDTLIDIPANMAILDALIEVTTNVAGSSIDVGIASGEAGGDADGLLDGVSCAALGIIDPIVSHATEANLTLGALLGTHQKSADATPLYEAVRKKWIGDGTATSVTYTTTNHDIAGNIILVLAYPGFRIVGQAEEDVSAAAADADLWVASEV